MNGSLGMIARDGLPLATDSDGNFSPEYKYTEAED